MINKEELYLKYKRLVPKVMQDLHCIYRTEEERQQYYDYAELGLIRGISNYDPTKELSTRYFYLCIRNSITNYFRAKNMQKRYLDYTNMASLDEEIYADTVEDKSVNIEKQIIEKETNEKLHKAINSLKPIYKDVICRYYGFYGKDYTLEEISQIYGISKQAVYVKKENALKQIKKEMIK